MEMWELVAREHIRDALQLVGRRGPHYDLADTFWPTAFWRSAGSSR